MNYSRRHCRFHWFHLILATLVLLLGISSAVPAQAIGTWDNAKVADEALRYNNGSVYGDGECKTFANGMVALASNNSINLGGYINGYSNSGGEPVSFENATKGDIIQVTPAGSTDQTVEPMFYAGKTALHTAIILTNKGAGKFDVIDANFVKPSQVWRHDDWDPASWAASNPGGGDVRIWRMGTVSNTPTPTASPVLQVNKRVQSDGTNQVYVARASTVDQYWWNTSTTKVQFTNIITIAQNNIVAIDSTIMPDGQHLLYTAVPDGVWESYWYPGQKKPTSSKIISGLTGVKKVQKTLQSNGYQQLYVMTGAGVYEYFWKPNTTIKGELLYGLNNPVDMVKIFEPNGSQSVYVADQAYVYRVNWGTSAGKTITPMINIAQRNIVSVDVVVASDGRHSLYTATDTGVWETNWYIGQPHSSRWIAGGTGIKQVQARIISGTYQVYVATNGGIYRYWWNVGSTSVNPVVIANLPAVRGFDEGINPDGARAVYTASGNTVQESYWFGNTGGVTTHELK